MRNLAVAMVWALGSLPAAAGFVTYSEWAASPREERDGYIAGAFDTLTSVASSDDEGKLAVHRLNCVVGSKMNSDQLAQNVIAFASARPEVQGGTVQLALIKYLIALCGPVTP